MTTDMTRAQQLNTESPLIEWTFPKQYLVNNRPAGVVFEELMFRTHINLRCTPFDEMTQNTVAAVLEARLPTEPNMFVEIYDSRVFWLAPNEWLIVAPATEGYLVEKLELALEGMHHAVTELTGGQTIIRIAGPGARETLAQGCTVDLHPTVFRANCCAQTLLANVPVLLCVVSASNNSEPIFDVIIRRSIADYLARWLIDGAFEIGFECRFSSTTTREKSESYIEEVSK